MKNDRYFIDIAKITATRSKCVSLKVGAVIVKDDRIITQGYNGTLKGLPNCNEIFPAKDDPEYDREAHHQFANNYEMHAEMNALCFAAKNGIATDGCTIYVTHQPCDNCIKHLASAGIVEVVYETPYGKSSPDNEITQHLIIRKVK